jgi:hypothetical protein
MKTIARLLSMVVLAGTTAVTAGAWREPAKVEGVDGDKMKGKVSYEGAGDETWTATRQRAAAASMPSVTMPMREMPAPCAASITGMISPYRSEPSPRT